jgi:hypothetical protein
MKIQKCLLVLLVPFICFSCQNTDRATVDPVFQKALENGQLANEGYRRCIDYVYHWLEHADPETGLIPRNLRPGGQLWNAQDAAADNYPFMVLTAAIVDRELYEGRMLEILKAEQKYTNRLDRLPDTYSFAKKGFVNEKPDKNGIIFGASEYIKDGLLPLTEYIGKTPWSERMIELIDDIWKHADIKTSFGTIPSLDVEVNGELLQALSRVYWMTNDRKYLEWAVRLGDYYLLGNNHPTRNLDKLRLRDHGCEIVSGLCEIYVTVASAMPDKKEQYRKPIYEMLDRILEVGTNEHGMFYNLINPITGDVLDKRIADTYGYTYNAYYTVFMLDNHIPYRDAVIKALGNLGHYKNYEWEVHGTGMSADGYADAIESALNLFNREQVAGVDEWVDSEMQVMWSLQDSSHMSDTEQWRGRGVIEGWHGDGNFARTTIMYNLWKTQGTTMMPWDRELVYGAENDEGIIKLAMVSGKDWEGKLHFDPPRHKKIFNLPLDYPRINQLPEWFTVDEGKRYSVKDLMNKTETVYQGSQLLQGINVQLEKDKKLYLEIKEQVQVIN